MAGGNALTIILKDAADRVQELTRATAPEILIVEGKFYLRMSVQESRAIYKETSPEEL